MSEITYSNIIDIIKNTSSSIYIILSFNKMNILSYRRIISYYKKIKMLLFI